MLNWMEPLMFLAGVGTGTSGLLSHFVSNPTNRLPHATLQRYVGAVGRDAGSLCFLPDRFGFTPSTYLRFVYFFFMS